MDESHKTLQRLERLRQLNTDRNWINSNLYRLMYKEDLYVLAYERIKSAPGNMTPGTDGKTIDGISMCMIQHIIEEMRTERFQFKPVRTVYLPKPNGKKRKLGIPSTRDKIVQEVIRTILECIYDSPKGPYFHETSHGFRPNRSCHTALREIRGKWPAINWFLEGDIQSCFDAIDHGVLVSLLRKKIRDERFLNLIWKLLRAGYLDLREARHDSLAGTPQGGLASPILANVYLHELDEKVEEMCKQVERGGKRKRRNPLYHKLSEQKLRLVKKGATRTKEFRELVRQIRNMPAVDVDDPNFIRLKYLRYADDWLVGICGPRKLAEQVKEELKTFLSQRLKLTLSAEKTKITHARKEQAHFLGTRLAIGREGIQRVVTTNNGSVRPVKRRSTGWEIVMVAPRDELIKKLHAKGFCTALGQPTTKLGWIHLDADQIIALYNGINRGVQNYYRFADNFSHLIRIQYILKFSLAHTLAAKYKCSVRQVFKRFGKTPTVTIKAKDGKRDRQVAFYNNNDWKKQRNGFQINQATVDQLRWSMKLRSRSKLGMPCCICSSSEQVEMHHVRHIRKTGAKKPAGINAILQLMNRKQIPVCSECHQKIHRGDYSGIRLSDLAYNPYESVQRRRFRESRMR
ncbi:reverse transcriptase/maturase family protein [Ktedonobacter racemifer]|uniref:RNA-directed DNA polymerase n=1 Tax=Ktedonobacter racemifer DSM 44963 TaxID=485913 RepID=D6U2Z5_KTERA|nr:reverse transcriptase/maturase family protein [Ktedonobacter racemifer]EFH82900.1 RNA-directed DNA polymerase [Ktedonobacter racemifer DSM 44963]